jgi:hypothetical protein
VFGLLLGRLESRTTQNSALGFMSPQRGQRFVPCGSRQELQAEWRPFRGFICHGNSSIRRVRLHLQQDFSETSPLVSRLACWAASLLSLARQALHRAVPKPEPPRLRRIVKLERGFSSLQLPQTFVPHGSGVVMHPFYIYHGCMVNYSLRVPDELYAKIKVAAEQERRSIHAEILWLLEQSLEAQ